MKGFSNVFKNLNFVVAQDINITLLFKSLGSFSDFINLFSNYRVCRLGKI